MVYFNSLKALIGVMALAAMAMPAHADNAASSDNLPVVQIVSAPLAPAHCEGVSPDQARRLAQQAERDGSHRRAAECFRIAGDLVQSDRALIRASADTHADATRKAAVTAEAARLQARRLRDAFR
jgi:hypothetical protein